MKFSCETALLSSAVATTSRAVAIKGSIPAMAGILIEADTRLRLTGSNLETGIQATVPAEIQEPGSQMCIRDRVKTDHPQQQGLHSALPRGGQIPSFRISCRKLRSSSP